MNQSLKTSSNICIFGIRVRRAKPHPLKTSTGLVIVTQRWERASLSSEAKCSRPGLPGGAGELGDLISITYKRVECRGKRQQFAHLRSVSVEYWVSLNKRVAQFTHATLRTSPLCWARPQINTTRICLYHGIALAPRTPRTAIGQDVPVP